MRLSKAFVFILPALAAASAVSSVQQLENASVEPATSQSTSTQVSSTEDVPVPTPIFQEHSLELRQPATPGAGGAVATTAASQQNPITTAWVPSMIGPSSSTYVEVIYTQTFAEVPAQGASAASGSVGLGTITGQVGVMHTTAAEKDSGVASLNAEKWSLQAIMGIVVVFWFLL